MLTVYIMRKKRVILIGLNYMLVIGQQMGIFIILRKDYGHMDYLTY